jgi:hypothetical protein
MSENTDLSHATADDLAEALVPAFRLNQVENADEAAKIAADQIVEVVSALGFALIKIEPSILH